MVCPGVKKGTYFPLKPHFYGDQQCQLAGLRFSNRNLICSGQIPRRLRRMLHCRFRILVRNIYAACSQYCRHGGQFVLHLDINTADIGKAVGHTFRHFRGRCNRVSGEETAADCQGALTAGMVSIHEMGSGQNGLTQGVSPFRSSRPLRLLQ